MGFRKKFIFTTPWTKCVIAESFFEIAFVTFSKRLVLLMWLLLIRSFKFCKLLEIVCI